MRQFGGGRASGFEFDNHDREEYFEQPKSYSERKLRCKRESEEQVVHTAVSTKLGHSMHSALEHLQSLEEESEKECKAHEFRSFDVARSVELRLATSNSRVAGRRRQTTQCESMGANASGAVLPESSTSSMSRKCAEMKVLTTKQLKLVAVESLKEISLFLRMLREDSVQNEDTVLLMLCELKCALVTTDLLRTTGIGVELNQSFWKRHHNPEIASRCSSLISTWRTQFLAERAGA